MALDPHLPVIVGVGETVHRDADSPEPAQLMAAAVHAALADAGTGNAFLKKTSAIAALTPGGWLDGDPGRRVAELLGIEARTVRASMFGGNGPQLLVNELGQRIQGNELDAALVCSGEAINTLRKARAAGGEPDWPAPDGARQADEVLEADLPAGTEAETEVGMFAPIIAYPLIENAIRAATGRTAAEQLELIASVWSRFSAVAAEQPAAWTRTAYSAEQLRTPSAENRPVTFPYLKLLNANITVDQGAALLLCSVATAEALGVPRERWTFLHAGARATDEWNLSERRSLAHSPAIAACGEAAFGHARVEADELGPIDLYSCFPSAVQLAAGALGLPFDDPARPLTSTGGLTFFGGPGNGYATHGIAAVARALRAAPDGTRGLATALGWYATKHAVGVYGNAPPEQPFAALAPEPADPGARTVAEPGDYTATAETCTVVYDREGAPAVGTLFALRADGSRALGKSDDPEVMAAMEADGFLGSPVALRADRSFAPA